MTEQTTSDGASTVAAALTGAWNAAEGAAFARVFTDDADFVNIFGTRLTGRDAIARQHQLIFDTIYRGSVSAFTVAKTRRISDDAVVVLIEAQVKTPQGQMAGEVRTVITGVLVRDGDAWKIASFQNTREQAPPAFVSGPAS